MPSVELKLYATLTQYAPSGSEAFSVEIQSGETLGELLERLGVPTSGARITLIDSVQCRSDHPLVGGEHIGVFPAIGGG